MKFSLGVLVLIFLTLCYGDVYQTPPCKDLTLTGHTLCYGSGNCLDLNKYVSNSCCELIFHSNGNYQSSCQYPTLSCPNMILSTDCKHDSSYYCSSNSSISLLGSVVIDTSNSNQFGWALDASDIACNF
mmetsp:Transcript_19581/g.26978  ORF Transcript_19581/g.26978 Transcript_19581/m.26978 type:complete len:129 (-) Transcript_19581:164-550(-)